MGLGSGASRSGDVTIAGRATKQTRKDRATQPMDHGRLRWAILEAKNERKRSVLGRPQWHKLPKRLFPLTSRGKWCELATFWEVEFMVQQCYNGTYIIDCPCMIWARQVVYCQRGEVKKNASHPFLFQSEDEDRFVPASSWFRCRDTMISSQWVICDKDFHVIKKYISWIDSFKIYEIV